MYNKLIKHQVTHFSLTHLAFDTNANSTKKSHPTNSIISKKIFRGQWTVHEIWSGLVQASFHWQGKSHLTSAEFVKFLSMLVLKTVFSIEWGFCVNQAGNRRSASQRALHIRGKLAQRKERQNTHWGRRYQVHILESPSHHACGRNFFLADQLARCPCAPGNLLIITGGFQ